MQSCVTTTIKIPVLSPQNIPSCCSFVVNTQLLTTPELFSKRIVLPFQNVTFRIVYNLLSLASFTYLMWLIHSCCSGYQFFAFFFFFCRVILFPKVVLPFCISTNSMRVSVTLHLQYFLYFVCFLSFSHPKRCAVVAHCPHWRF